MSRKKKNYYRFSSGILAVFILLVSFWFVNNKFQINKAKAADNPPTFLYLLSNYVEGGTGIRGYAPDDTTVIDLASEEGYTPDYIVIDLDAYYIDPETPDPLNNMESSWTSTDLLFVKNGISYKSDGLVDTKILAYFEIGAMEGYRDEFEYAADNDLVFTKSPGGVTINGYTGLCGVGGYSDEAYAKFGANLPGADNNTYDLWLNHIMRGRIQAAINAGFDGIYLDMTTAYEEITGIYDSSTRCTGFLGNESELTDRGTDSNTSLEMKTLIMDISDLAKNTLGAGEDFLIIPQNSPELFDNRIGYYYFETENPPETSYYDLTFLASIDGIGIEDSFGQENSPYYACENDYSVRCEDWQQYNYFVAKNMLDETVDPDFFCTCN